MNLDPSYIFELLPRIISYVPITLFMAVVAMIIAIIIGLVLTFLRNSRFIVFRSLASVYISFFRAIPMLVQLFLIYYGLPQLFPAFTAMDAVTAAIIGFGFKQAAFWPKFFAPLLYRWIRGRWKLA
ncbi:hypothetical protein PACILC2_38250 [Paenibacillus cisolokensis]|uniref:ABC transmembrane type-1 domain-containing protein n=1 Tax=Paenibacillus cisolokensis TaxID=1658519 RepID=A0ABQ4NAJ9_9BACL|nr:hypothetical protein PACILC2_38250 [Paenibacillus cisolokensis]